jgi:hypothetical protein
MKTYGEVDILDARIHVFFTLALVGRYVVSLTPRPLRTENP